MPACDKFLVSLYNFPQPAFTYAPDLPLMKSQVLLYSFPW